jgi:hypothetical protein
MTAWMPCRVYLAGSSAPAERERVRRWSAALTAAGIMVHATWPVMVGAVGAGEPPHASIADRRRRAVQYLTELRHADVLWVLCPPIDTPTRGAWIELGVAYECARLIVASGDTRQSVFAALAEEFTTDEDAFHALLLIAAGRARR